MQCPICQNAELRQVPAGISKKTGKPYNAFLSCPNGCKQQSPNFGGNVAPQAKFSPTSDFNKEDVNWTKISWGKCKHAYLVEAFKNQINVNPKELNLGYWETKAEEWATASMRKLGEPSLLNLGKEIEVDQIPFN